MADPGRLDLKPLRGIEQRSDKLWECSHRNCAKAAPMHRSINALKHAYHHDGVEVPSILSQVWCRYCEQTSPIGNSSAPHNHLKALHMKQSRNGICQGCYVAWPS
ncbi:hypothetical protein JCM3766R1_006613 [Sporobolomyces carnicolor]